MILLLLLLGVVTSLTAPATGDGEALPVMYPISSSCNSTTSAVRTYQRNSRFEANLARASRLVPTNASASGGFFKGSFGAAPDTLYTLALCRGDIPPAACASCLEAAFQRPQDLCNRSKDVTMYYDQCQIRYFDQDFLAGAGNEPEKVAWNMNNISATVFPGWDPQNGDSVSFATGTVYTLLRETANWAAYNSSRRFGTSRMVVSSTFPTLYSLTQCTPDLSPDACFSCLQDIIQQTLKWFEGRQGGRILGVRCVIRYETGVFFLADEDTRYMGPAESKTTGNGGRSKTKLGIIAAVVTLLMLVLCSIGGFVWIRSHRKGKMLLQDNLAVNLQQEEEFVWMVEGNISSDFLFDVAQIQEATSNFSEDNKLG